MVGKLAAPMPQDLLASLRIHDGLRDSYLGQIRLFNYWALLPIAAIDKEWTSMCALQAECEFGGDQLTRGTAMRNDAHWRPSWLPFMDADGDKLILDLDPGSTGIVGQIVRWSNSGSSPMRVLAPSYRAWLSQLADRLAARQFRLDSHGGIWFDGLSLG